MHGGGADSSEPSVSVLEIGNPLILHLAVARGKKTK